MLSQKKFEFGNQLMVSNAQVEQVLGVRQDCDTPVNYSPLFSQVLQELRRSTCCLVWLSRVERGTLASVLAKHCILIGNLYINNLNNIPN